jgi:hypothetical protein
MWRIHGVHPLTRLASADENASAIHSFAPLRTGSLPQRVEGRRVTFEVVSLFNPIVAIM